VCFSQQLAGLVRWSYVLYVLSVLFSDNLSGQFQVCCSLVAEVRLWSGADSDLVRRIDRAMARVPHPDASLLPITAALWDCDGTHGPAR